MSDKGNKLITQLTKMGLTPRAISRWSDEFGCSTSLNINNFDFIGNSVSCTDEELTELGKISLAAQGGNYNDGGTFWKVFTFEKYGISLGIQAVYSSWDDSHYNGNWKEVTSKEVMVTKWFDEKGNDLDTEI